jgi:sulfatase modifying factor 1
MVLIPAGDFVMGRQSGSGFSDELPIHPNPISAFYLDQFEVTKALWDDVYTYATNNSYGFGNAGSGQGAFHPVHTVNWFDVVKWCNARSEKEGLTPVYYTDAGFTTVFNTGVPDPFANGFRLPTEAEWEKAAHGTLVGNTYPWGNSITGADANYSGSGDPFGSELPDTTPVGFYDGEQWAAYSIDRANGYGLYDMSGNVYEWCWDWYDGGYYAVSPSTDPRGPASGILGVSWGGSWFSISSCLRCAFRNFLNPVFVNNSFGFRSARGLQLFPLPL